MRYIQNLLVVISYVFLVLVPIPVTAQSNKIKTISQSEQRELNRLLLSACQDADLPNDLPKIVELLEKGADLEATNSSGQTPLIIAALEPNGKLIDFLLKAGANPLAQDDDGYPVDWFVGLGADTDGLSESTKSLIKETLQKPIVTRIREAAAARKAKTLEFMDAVVTNDTGKALKLLYAGRVKGDGINLGSVQKQDKGPLREDVYPDYIDGRYNNSTALIIASFKGNNELVSALLKENIRINRYNNKHQTALHNAIGSGKLEVAKLLLKGGADADFVDRDGVTPLLITVIEGNPEAAKLLLENKANVNLANSPTKLTPLHLAIATKHFALVPIFLKAGANPNLQAANGATPLMLAAAEGDESTVISLLQNGANPNLKNNQGNTALEYARQKNQAVIVKILTDGTYTKPEFKD